MTEFSNLEMHPVRPRIQDIGASVLLLKVRDVDAALTTAKKAGAEVITTGGSPVTVKFGGRNSRAVHVRDPDGYYLELAQPPDTAPGSGNITDAGFASVVRDCEAAASFYRDKLGLDMKINAWSSNDGKNMGTPSAQSRSARVSASGSRVSWIFGEFKDIDRKAHAPSIPDPGAPAVGMEVRHIDAAIATVKAAGGTSITQGGSIKLGNNKVGFVRDPSGVLVEFTQR